MASILDKKWDPENILDIFKRDQDIRILEISKKDEKIEGLVANTLNIKHKAVFVPWVLQTLYDTDSKNIKKLYQEGYITAEKTLNNF
jgi:hypothetical protein